MPVSPTGELSSRIDTVRSMLSACTTFQEFVGVDEETDPAEAALAWIFVVGAYLDDVKDEGQPMHAHAVITVGSNHRSRAVAGGVKDTFSTQGSVRVSIVGSVPSDYADGHADAGYWFLNVLGGILSELRAQCGVGVSEFVREIGIASAPRRADDMERNTFSDVYQCEIEILTGLDAG